MIKKLLIGGLIIIPFITGLHLDPVMPFFRHGIISIKSIISLIIACLIILYSIYYGQSKPFKYKLFLGLLFYLIVSPLYAPPYIELYKGYNISGFWSYKPLLEILIYSGMIIVLSGIRIEHKEFNRILKVMMWCGSVMAGYIVLQYLKLEQLYIMRDVGQSELAGGPTNPHIFGFVGNGTLAAAFITICIPICLYFKKWIHLIIMFLAVCLTKSQVAIVGSILSASFFGIKHFGLSLQSILICMFLLFLLPIGYQKIQDNGRFSVWKQIVKDWYSPFEIYEITDDMEEDEIKYISMLNKRKQVLTGKGLGSFKYIFSDRHKTIFKQAHNEFLEILDNIGMVGLGLVLANIIFIFYMLRIGTGLDTVLLSCFVASCLCAAGTFIWQVEPTRFYSVSICGLLYNRIRNATSV